MWAPGRAAGRRLLFPVPLEEQPDEVEAGGGEVHKTQARDRATEPRSEEQVAQPCGCGQGRMVLPQRSPGRKHEGHTHHERADELDQSNHHVDWLQGGTLGDFDSFPNCDREGSNRAGQARAWNSLSLSETSRNEGSSRTSWAKLAVAFCRSPMASKAIPRS